MIGWEYSTNDDFQDVVCTRKNAILIEPPAAGTPSSYSCGRWKAH